MTTSSMQQVEIGTASSTIQIDLVELETFLVVLELGSFSLAARKLHISQPSVTGRIRRLESTLKTKLLIRTTRKVEATMAGSRLYEKAQVALRDLRALLSEFRIEAEEVRRRVVVASTPMIAAVMLPPIIRAFCNRYTDVHIQLRDQQYEDVVHLIETGAADMGVVAFDNNSSKLTFHPLMEEDMLLVVPVTHPLANSKQATLDEVVNLPLMLLERYSSLTAELTQEMSKYGLPFRPVQEVANLNTLLGMVDAGNCATFLPRSMAHAHSRGTRAMLEIKDLRLRRSYGILQSRKNELSPFAESFCRYLQEEFRKNFDLLEQNG